MTDQDRGAYTPPTEEALAFDARRQSERRPAPMTLVGSVVVVVVMIVGVAVVYRGGVRNANEAPRPVGQPVVSVKTPPPAVAIANSVGADSGSDTKSVAAAPIAASPVATAPPVPSTTQTTTPQAPPQLKPAAKLATKADTPNFAPAPEQPAPRPTPAARTLALLDQPNPSTGSSRVKVVPPPGRPIRSAGGLDASEVAAAGMTGSAPAVSHAAPASAPYKVATATPAPSIDSILARSSEVSAGPVVQIGAFSSPALSAQGYADVSKIMAAHMAGKAKHVMTVDHDGATLFRTWVSGFATRAQAQAFCAELKANNKPCFVKG